VTPPAYSGNAMIFKNNISQKPRRRPLIPILIPALTFMSFQGDSRTYISSYRAKCAKILLFFADADNMRR
jgi:hypothetical protein